MYKSAFIFSPSLLDKLTNSAEAISQKLSIEEGEQYKTAYDLMAHYLWFNPLTVLSISTDGRWKVSATSLREVGYLFPKSK